MKWEKVDKEIGAEEIHAPLTPHAIYWYEKHDIKICTSHYYDSAIFYLDIYLFNAWEIVVVMKNFGKF